jgi:hypothetical protein
MGKKELAKIFVVLLLSYFCLLTAFTLFGSYYARVLFPLFREEIHLLSSGVEVLSVGFEKYQDQNLVSMKVELTGHQVSRRLSFRWPPMNMYIYPIIIFTFLSAWPGIILKDRVKLFAISFPLLLIVEMIDIPLLTLSRCETLAHALISEDGALPPLTNSYWLSFLSNGGREFLSILTAILSLAIFFLLKVKGIPKPQRNAPCPCGSGKKYKKCCMTG